MFFRKGGALTVLQTGDGERVGGDADRLTSGVADQVALRVLLVGGADVVEAAGALGVGAFVARAGDEPEAAVRKILVRGGGSRGERSFVLFGDASARHVGGGLV